MWADDTYTCREFSSASSNSFKNNAKTRKENTCTQPSIAIYRFTLKPQCDSIIHTNYLQFVFSIEYETFRMAWSDTQKTKKPKIIINFASCWLACSDTKFASFRLLKYLTKPIKIYLFLLLKNLTNPIKIKAKLSNVFFPFLFIFLSILPSQWQLSKIKYLTEPIKSNKIIYFFYY